MLAAFKIRAVPINVNYRYVEDELRYLLDDADAVAVMFHDDEFTDKLAAIAEPADPDVHRGRRRQSRSGATLTTTRCARGRVASSRLRGPLRRRPLPPLHRRHDGHAEGRDVASRRPLLRRDGRRGRRWRTDHDARRDRRALPRSRARAASRLSVHARHRALDGIQRAVHGRNRHHPGRAPSRSRSRCGSSSRASRRTSSSSSATRSRVRCSTRSTPNRNSPLDVSCLHVLLSGGAILSPALKQRSSNGFPALLVVDGYGASETGGQGQSVVVAGGEVPSAPRFRVGDDTQVLGADLRPARRRRRRAAWRAAGTSRSATTRTRRRPPRRSRSSTACAGRYPAITQSSRRTASITLLGRGSVSINTGGEKVYPEEVESVLKAHADVFDAVVVGVPDDRWGERVVAVVQRATRPRRPVSTRCKRTPGRRSRATRSRARSCSSTRSNDRRRGSPTTAGPGRSRRRAPGTVEA